MIACDTSFLVSWFVRDPNHPRATELVLSTTKPVHLSRLNRLEFETVILRMVGASQLTLEQGPRLISELERQISQKSFEWGSADDGAVWSRAMGLAGLYAAGLGVRTLDIWQVAFALEMGAMTFWSFDDRQRKLAVAVGLRVNA